MPFLLENDLNDYLIMKKLQSNSQHTVNTVDSHAGIDYVARESPEDLVHLLPAAERKEKGRSDNQDSWTCKEPKSQVMPTDPPLIPPPPPPRLLVLKPDREDSQ